METILIRDATLVNEGEKFRGSVFIRDQKIDRVIRGDFDPENPGSVRIIDARGLYLLPGIIDDQVHFREPGITHKGDIFSETRAAVAGGVTSIMEMPNTIPQTTTNDLLDKKFATASSKSLCNYSFYLGATNDNLDELLKTDPADICGIKIFMGSSTGNMLVDNNESLEKIFSRVPNLLAVHCEDESTIKENIAVYKNRYGEEIPVEMHPRIRTAEACYLSSSFAVRLAKKYGARLHILHLSTARELELFNRDIPVRDKRITAEVCIHHLWFDDKDYETRGNLIKWNPAIKSSSDKNALLEAVLNDTIDVIATDHAPHTLKEKENSYFKSPSGGPLVQHSLIVMLELHHQGKISIEKIVQKMCHAPADIFHVKDRGYLRENYWADLVLVDPSSPWTVTKENILYKCGWSPFENIEFQSKVTHTFVNGIPVYEQGKINDSRKGMKLEFGS